MAQRATSRSAKALARSGRRSARPAGRSALRSDLGAEPDDHGEEQQPRAAAGSARDCRAFRRRARPRTSPRTMPTISTGRSASRVHCVASWVAGRRCVGRVAADQAADRVGGQLPERAGRAAVAVGCRRRISAREAVMRSAAWCEQRDRARLGRSARRPARPRPSRVLTKASTTTGSNWTPANLRSSASACSFVSGVIRYGRAAVIASNASATWRIRASFGISSPISRSG